MKLAILAFAVAVSIAIPRARAANAPPLVVHEWGTFTCLQDETGRAIGGINTDDEPVPAFVHRTGIEIGDSNAIFSAGKPAPACDPSVTMRLERPVIYFHLPHGDDPRPVSVDVEFHGGRFTEFYPKAQPFIGQTRDLPELSPDAFGSLSWQRAMVGAGATLVTTDNRAWIASRSAKAVPISVDGESEDFLFYGGVGAIDAPLQVQRIGNSGQFKISLQGVNGRSKGEEARAAELAHSPVWLVRVSNDGHVRWRRGYSPALGLDSSAVLGDTRIGFADDTVGLPSLRKDMAAFLVKAGLFPDEAEAMLNTWEISYFKHPGTRLFFLAPQAWTDHVLPLHISGNPELRRVMVGRIEIVTPAQRDYIKQIESPTPADGAYLLLGRFRDAILLDEQTQRPNAALAKFLKSHGIRAGA